MQDELLIVVKVPLRTLADQVRTRHNLTETFFDAKLEGEALTLYFRNIPNDVEGQYHSEFSDSESTSYSFVSSADTSRYKDYSGKERGLRRQRKLKRNRMKTRGWQVVGKIVNSKGQTAVVYKPFVDAIFAKNLTPAQERNVVAQILRSNSNDPTDSSVEYFLMNTKEYIQQANKGVGTA